MAVRVYWGEITSLILPVRMEGVEMVILHSGVPCSLARHGVGPFSSRKKIYKSFAWAGAYQGSSSLHLVGPTYFQCSLKLEGWSRHEGHVLFYA